MIMIMIMIWWNYIKYKKKHFKTLKKYLQQKYQKKKILYKVFGGNIYSKNSKYNFFFLYFLYIKGLDIKMDLISIEGYENAKVICLKNKNGDLWVIMKDVKDGLGVKNMSDLVLKGISGVYGKKFNKRRN